MLVAAAHAARGDSGALETLLGYLHSMLERHARPFAVRRAAVLVACAWRQPCAGAPTAQCAQVSRASVCCQLPCNALQSDEKQPWHYDLSWL